VFSTSLVFGMSLPRTTKVVFGIPWDLACQQVELWSRVMRAITQAGLLGEQVCKLVVIGEGVPPPQESDSHGGTVNNFEQQHKQVLRWWLTMPFKFALVVHA